MRFVSIGAQDTRAWLKRHNRTQAEFAEHVGVTPECVCRWLTGKIQPSEVSALAIQAVTGVDAASWRVEP